MADIQITCKCGKLFIFTEKDQIFYRQKGFDQPKRCSNCRAKKKERSHSKRKLDSLDDKEWGICMSCGFETFLVEDLGLCGPCCWGEAETINGNW